MTSRAADRAFTYEKNASIKNLHNQRDLHTISSLTLNNSLRKVFSWSKRK